MSPATFKLKWYRLCMYCSFQSNDLAFDGGVSVWTPNYQFLKFLFFHAKTEISEALKTGTWSPLCLVTSPAFPSFRYPLYIYFRSRTNIHYTRRKQENKDLFVDIVRSFWSIISSYSYKIPFLVNTCTIN